MIHCQQHPLLKLLIGFIFLGCATGCSSFVADREQGFTMMQRGFSELEPTPELYREVTLQQVKVVIVGDRQQFRWSKAAAENSGILGYATPDNEIWVFGKVVNGEIVVNEAVLGHELTHLLNFQDTRIANPDTLSNLNSLQAQKPEAHVSAYTRTRNGR